MTEVQNQGQGYYTNMRVAQENNMSSIAQQAQPSASLQHDLLARKHFVKYFGNLEETVKIDDAALFASFLDASVELDHQHAFEKRRKMLDQVAKGDLSGLSFIEPNPSWRPKPYSKNYQRYYDAVLEMTGNALNRMGINAFNFVNSVSASIAKETGDQRPKIAWMCCGEDANGAQIESVVENIRHLRDLITGEAKYEFNIPNGTTKTYKLESKEVPPCSYRPRGLHCVDSSIARYSTRTNQKEPVLGSMLDLALWAKYVLPELTSRNILPLLYIPKMYLPEDAALWHKAIKLVEADAKIPEGTIKIVFLAETFPAVFKVAGMIEAFEGRCIGVNCGRWDYLFSYVAVLYNATQANVDGTTVNTKLPPKHTVTTAVDLLKKYQIKVAQTCHKYGIQFIGGMNATLPSTNPDLKKREQENAEILRKTRENKSQEREFYGAGKTWVAHIGLLEVAKTLNQVKHPQPIDKNIREIVVTRKDMFAAPTTSEYTLESFKNDYHVVLLYMTTYLLNRNGAVAIDNMMEDLATSEISSSLNWYYLRHGLLDKQIKQAGGLKAIEEHVAKEVLPKVLAAIPSKDTEKRAAAEKLLQGVRRVYAQLLQHLQEKPSLEKVLYIMGNTYEPNFDSFKLISNSKRFTENSVLAKRIGAEPFIMSNFFVTTSTELQALTQTPTTPGEELDITLSNS